MFPDCLEDWVVEINPVRAIDAFVAALDLGVLGFAGVEPAARGRPSYHPSALLKQYIYGYRNRVQSSRRLEREAGRNVEVMWLLGRLVPDDKVIADFRKDNGKSIRQVCARFGEMGLLATASVAIDDSKFKAGNNRDKNFTRGKVERRQAQLEESVARYLSQLDTADRHEPTEALVMKAERLKEKLAKLKDEMAKLATIEAQMLASPNRQVSLTDPDSRSMATSGRGSGVVGCNVQVGVDTEHHLIVAHEVTASGSDRSQLANMAKRAKAVLRISRGVAAIFSDETLREHLAMRGGTVLHKGHLVPAARYSEDIDLVLVRPMPNDGLERQLQRVLTPTLGKPYRSAIEDVKLALRNVMRIILRFVPLDLQRPEIIKVEVNLDEAASLYPMVDVAIKSITEEGEIVDASARSYDINEMLETKIRALLQRNQGRDVFDLHHAWQLGKTGLTPYAIDGTRAMAAFTWYMEQEGARVRATDANRVLSQHRSTLAA